MIELVKYLNSENLYEEDIQNQLRQLSIQDREKLALITQTMVQYYGEEVALVQQAETKAAMRALPFGIHPSKLNVIDLGAGERKSGDYVIPVDGDENLRSKGIKSMLLANVLDLPFKNESVDCIIALHTLEHLQDPVASIRYWLSLIKPGGGLGIVLPDWRYTWDSKNDRHPWGHRWNPAPEEFVRFLKNNLEQGVMVESSVSYDYKISFDVVLRKDGVFRPYNTVEVEAVPSGYDIYKNSPEKFLHFSS